MQEQNWNLFSGETTWLNQQTRTGETIQRVKSLWVNNFRGIPLLEKPLNTDADVVLITGPNGFGKTSLIDALCLLLTGHYYLERLPLLTSIEGLNQGDEAIIKAEILFADDRKVEAKEIKIKNISKEIYEITGFTWPNEIPGEIVARASFFYQDLLNRLFDEDGADKTLRDCLTPPPPQVEETRKAIKKAITRLKTEESNLFKLPGVLSEEEIKNQRAQAVKEFLEAWVKLSSIADSLGLVLPKRSEDWLLLIRGGNLRSGWQGELRNLANELLEAFPAEKISPLPENTDPKYSLLRIEMLLQNVWIDIASKFENEKKLLLLVNSLPPQSIIPEEEKLEEEAQQLDEYKKEIDSLKEELNVLEKIEQHFQNPNGPGLPEILIAIRDNAQKWLDLPVKNLKNILPPQCILQWLEQSLKTFYVEEKGLDEYLDSWQEQIRTMRLQTRDVISEKERQYKTMSDILEISRKIYNLAADSIRIKLALEEAKKEDGKFIIRENLIFCLIGDKSEKNIFPDDPDKALTAVREAISTWLKVEESEKQRWDTIRKAQGYSKARERLDAVHAALKTESANRTSLIEKVLELPEKEIERFAELVNQVFITFRTVKGLCPVRFKSGKKIKGNSLTYTWNISTDDGRPLGALSTGQKAQLGLSLLISLNIALDHLIPHKIIALDDTTTALDMAQLPREASLLRQIAYGSNSNESFTRRQLFIVSHHEDLTHRLIDFLIPPEGRSMHILNFFGWSPEKGPKIEQLKVEPALSTNEKTKSDFVRLLCSGLRVD
ncbi:MAG: AAA family ATPase [Peptococcaceae bacterium]|nr:AAA family ATPase [Peptococcaceae bacterium]